MALTPCLVDFLLYEDQPHHMTLQRSSCKS
jgi:hypothetical protein